MSRATVGLDRLMTLVMGIVFISGGLLVLNWYYGWWGSLPESLDTDRALRVTSTVWWPWALAGAAILLFLLGVRWLVAHTPPGRVTELGLPGSGSEGRLEVDASGAVQAACENLQTRHDVRSAKGTVRRDRGQLLVDIRAVLEPHGDLRDIASAIDATTATLVNCLERPDLHCRVRLAIRTSSRRKALRVR
jgi:hypothetical protein